MNKHLKLFANHTAYEAAKNNIDKPNVVMCQQEDEVHFNPPQPIAPVGKAQVFANPQCTEYADGSSDTVWVRLNQDFGIDQRTEWGSITKWYEYLSVGTPSTEYPEDPYFVFCWVDWLSENFNEPFTSGDIIECKAPPEAVGEYDKLKVIFE
jgi:hypothetical protein